MIKRKHSKIAGPMTQVHVYINIPLEKTVLPAGNKMSNCPCEVIKVTLPDSCTQEFHKDFTI